MTEGPDRRPEWLRNTLCILWYIGFPIVLVWHSIRIYLLPCIAEFIGGVFSLLCFECATATCGACCGDMRYTDHSFPAGPASVGGKFKDDASVKWLRASEVVAPSAGTDVETGTASGGGGGAHLFEGGIAPSDIVQGALGDCWLLSAISVLAEKPGQIEQVFREKSKTVWGKYHLRLYDGRLKKWSVVSVDDKVPCDGETGTPLFTASQGSEMWVLLLEKAFAKMVGSYAALEGGLPLWALQAMTGDEVAHFNLDQAGTGQWQKQRLVHLGEGGKGRDKRKVGLHSVGAKERYSTEALFGVLESYEQTGAAMAAYSNGKSDKDSAQGIVEGHAYSILNVKHVGALKFLQLRNPWGTFSWEGDWGDASPLWAQHPEVAKALGVGAGTGRTALTPNPLATASAAATTTATAKSKKEDDGVFWMALEDFVQYFHGVDVLDRQVDIQDVVLSIDERDGRCLGPCKGCLRGCFRYYCCCEGASHLCCPHKSSKETQGVPKCWGLC